MSFRRGWRELEARDGETQEQGTDPTWYLIAVVAIVLLLAFCTR